MGKNYNYGILPSINMYPDMMYILDSLSPSNVWIILRWIKWYAFEECEPTPEQIMQSDYRLQEAWFYIKKKLDKQFESWAEYIDKHNK